jgi:hypothetical protein
MHSSQYTVWGLQAQNDSQCLLVCPARVAMKSLSCTGSLDHATIVLQLSILGLYASFIDNPCQYCDIFHMNNCILLAAKSQPSQPPSPRLA